MRNYSRWRDTKEKHAQMQMMRTNTVQCLQDSREKLERKRSSQREASMKTSIHRETSAIRKLEPPMLPKNIGVASKNVRKCFRIYRVVLSTKKATERTTMNSQRHINAVVAQILLHLLIKNRWRGTYGIEIRKKLKQRLHLRSNTRKRPRSPSISRLKISSSSRL